MFISNKFYSFIVIRFLYTNRCRNMFLRFRWLRFYSYLWRRSARSWVQYTTSNAIFHGNRNHRVRDGRRRFNFSRAVLEHQSNSSASRGFLIERNTMGEIRDKVRKSSKGFLPKIRSKKHLCSNNFSVYNFHAQQCWGFVRNDDDSLRIPVFIATDNVCHGERWSTLWLSGPR